MGILRKLIYVFAIFFLAHHYLGIPKFSYVFTVKSIKNTAYKHSGMGYNSEKLQQDFYRQYPKYVSDGKQWIPAYTGGLQGAVLILYASLTEILVLYHSEMETTGNTGRHYMNVSVTVLTGSMAESTYNLLPPTTHKPGENKVFRIGEISTVKLSKKTAMLVYGRGFVPLTMGYWLSDSLFSNHDPLLAISSVFYYMKAVVMSISWEWLEQIYNYLQKVATEGFTYLLESTQYALNHLAETFNYHWTWIYASCVRFWERLMGV